MSVVCPSCGRDTPQGFPRCANCGAPLTVEAAAREERKVVTCLFCDLVGFTARAESMDPEDVRRLLQPYHARVRAELERFGGTVEKFIGDAVMAVFGAPVAHEDDTERAVRAALAIRDGLAEDVGLEVHIGIATGEALIALGARPEAGEGMASGDVVNTAARLQVSASANAVLVDGATKRATEGVIAYRATGPITAKGKAEPVTVWEALRALAPVGAERLGTAPLVGRTRELTTLTETFSRVVRERGPAFVLLVGVPGIGKSRLVRELFESVRGGSSGGVTWRRGRSLPYGEGVSFWAWGEIVKAEAGILETDTTHAAEAKLEQAVSLVRNEQEAEWVRRHLAPVLGVGGERDGDDRRAERFAAWRRYLGALAERAPLVVVFEDLHWADDGLLDFVGSLTEWMSGVPLLVLGTARPELLERRPALATLELLTLEPLSPAQTASLVDGLLADSRIPSDSREAVLEQVGGNPLYAEQYVRMLAESGEARGVPATLQALIAARLDLLAEREKRLVQDASVVGNVFWTGAVAAAAGSDRWTIDEDLRGLERRALVRRSYSSTVADETEYAFTHALIRDAAYAGIPRGTRAAKHVRVAAWIESLGRADEHAELLAHHYLVALDLGAAAGVSSPEVEKRAVEALRRAGDRAVSLYAFPTAAIFYRRVDELMRSEDPDRPRILLGLGRALFVSEARGEAELLAARDALASARDLEGAAEAETLLADLYRTRGERDAYARMLVGVQSLARELPPSAAKAQVLFTLTRALSHDGRDEQAVEVAREAVELAESVGLDELHARALSALGYSRAELGDDEGLADLERSIELSLALDSPVTPAGYANLAHQLRHRGEFVRSIELFEEALRLAERFGHTPSARFLRGTQPHIRYREGRWDEALALAEAFLEEVGREHFHVWHALGTRGLIRVSRADDAGLADAAASVDAARRSVEPSLHPAALEVYGRALVLAGRREEAAIALEETLSLFETGVTRSGFDLPLLVANAVELGGDPDRVLAAARPSTRWLEAARSYLDGDFRRAADVYAEIGSPTDEAEARLRAARSLLDAGRRDEGKAQLQRAVAFYRRVGAVRFLREAEALLGGAGLEIPA